MHFLLYMCVSMFDWQIVKPCTGQASVFVKIRHSIFKFTDISGIPVARTINVECGNMLFYKGLPDHGVCT